MNLEDLGYTQELKSFVSANGLDSFIPARVVAEHRERYMVQSMDVEYEAELIGNLRFTAQNRLDFPAVGDWVLVTIYDTNKALIHSLLPRKSILMRQTVGKTGEKQLIAANVDLAFIVMAVDRDFSVNRIERYLTLCNESKIRAVVVLNKIDLVPVADWQEKLELLSSRLVDIPIVCTTNLNENGLGQLIPFIQKQKTYCLLGSSGVGKSSILNNLLGEVWMKTDQISESTQRGKHVTTHRELRVLKNGGLIIDNPGMREIGIADSNLGLELTFEQISTLSDKCKFKNCTHRSENGCEVLKALDEGRINSASYENYLRMLKESQHYEATVVERKQKDKALGKLLKNYKKDQFGKYKN